jgi:hypothetical protein
MTGLRAEVTSFVDATKFLLVAGLFLTVGLFLILGYVFTDVGQNERGDTITVLANTPVLFTLEDLESGDDVYIQVSSSNYVDVLVDNIGDCRNYVDKHDAFNPATLPQSAYKAIKVTDETIKVTVNGSFDSQDGYYSLGIVFQKTPYTGYDPTDLTFTISFPDHMSQDMCIPVGVLFIAGAVALAVIHVYMARKNKQFEPLDEDKDRPKKKKKGTKKMDQDKKGKKKWEGGKESEPAKDYTAVSGKKTKKKGKQA